MFGKLLVRTVRFITQPFGFALLCLLIAAWVFQNRHRLTGEPEHAIEQEFRSAMKEMATHDPKVAQRLREIENHEIRMGLIAAARSAGDEGDRRPILASMVGEYAQEREPYRVQLASIPFFEEQKFKDETNLNNFMNAHATVLETMELSGYGKNTTVYMQHLQQARQNPVLWPMVWDDPLALTIWVETQDIQTVRIYHRNREWLADALAMLDFDSSEWTLQTAIHRLAPFEATAKVVVEDEELGSIGLAVMLTHGALIDRCWREHGIEPLETVAVIYLNDDMIGEREASPQWIAEKAAWLAVIRKNHPVVWLSAMEFPFTLRLFQDAPTVASSVLERYGYMDVPTMIYQHFEEPELVDAALRAIDVFGDLAFFVFSHYSHDPHFSASIARYLVDPEIGIRVVPFVVRFGDEAFLRIERNKAWVERYYEPSGRPREDPMNWIQYLPGGAAVHVARNWAQGYPCEFGELGWAAFDVASAALAVASFGKTAPVTTKARTAAQAKRTSATVLRETAASQWSRKLRVVQQGGPFRHLATFGRIAVDTARFAGAPIWAGIRVVRWAGHIVLKGLKATVQAWSHIPISTRRIIYRGLLATALYIRITETTMPNMDKIGAGVGVLTARISAGTIKTLSTAVSTAVSETMKEFYMSDPVRSALVYVVLGGLLFLALGGAVKGVWMRWSTQSAVA